MGFMEKQITDKRDWLEIETASGTFFIDAVDAPQTAVDFAEAVKDGLHDSDEVPATVRCDLVDYTEEFHADGIYSVELVSGHGARMSAPGYMDCTDWSVFDTVEEAEEHLDELYGDDA